MKHTISPYDEALVMVGATRVMDGAVPYRDFYANYGPAQFYVVAGFFHVFGVSVIVERAWDTIVRAATAVAAFELVRLVCPRWYAWVAAIATAVWLGDIDTYGYTVLPCLLFCVLSVMFLALADRGRQRQAGWLVVSGLMAGATALFRFDVGVYNIVVLVLAAILLEVRGAKGERLAITETARTAGLCLAGVAIVCCPAALALALSGAVPDLIFDNLTFPAASYRAMRSLPFPLLHEVVDHPRLVAIYAPLVISFWALAALVVDMTTRRLPERLTSLRWLVIVLVLLSCCLYIKGIVRVSVIHAALSLVPAVLLSVVLLRLCRASLSAGAIAINAMVTTAAVVAAVPTVFAVRNDYVATRKNIEWASNPATWTDALAPSSCRPTPPLSRMRCFDVDPTWAKAVMYVQDHSRPDQPIFVGVSQHDKIFVNDMLLYFATKRRPATKWYHFDPGLQTSTPIQSAIIDDLKTQKPPFIVLTNTWAHYNEPNASGISSGVLLLDNYLVSHYRVTENLGPNAVLAPRED